MARLAIEYLHLGHMPMQYFLHDFKFIGSVFKQVDIKPKMYNICPIKYEVCYMAR